MLIYAQDNRLLNAGYVEIELVNHMSIIDISRFFAPYFVITDTIPKSGTILAIIKPNKTKCKDFFCYLNNIFYIDTCEDDNAQTCYNVLKILRTIFKITALEYGYINLHAGCIAYGKAGILITADRNQGKTTLLLHALETECFSFVANDQVMFHPTNYRTLGYPALVGIRNGRLKLARYKEICQNALWNENDRFINKLKPIIHFANLADIYHCSVARECISKHLIIYEKSNVDSELSIFSVDTNNLNLIHTFNLPINDVYDNFLIDSCTSSLNHYANYNDSINAYYPSNLTSLNVLRVRCGINRLGDFTANMLAYLNF